MTRVRTLEHIADVRRRPGVQRPVVRTFPAEALGPIGTSSATVPPDGEIALDGTLEATGLDIVLTGVATAPWEGECRRCLDPAVGDLVVDLREVFEPDPVDGETFPIVDERIDLGAVLRELLALALPLAPLCAETCPGPDPEAHPVATEDPDDGDAGADAGPPADPRWAALDQLRFDA